MALTSRYILKKRVVTLGEWLSWQIVSLSSHWTSFYTSCFMSYSKSHLPRPPLVRTSARGILRSDVWHWVSSARALPRITTARSHLWISVYRSVRDADSVYADQAVRYLENISLYWALCGVRSCTNKNCQIWGGQSEMWIIADPSADCCFFAFPGLIKTPRWSKNPAAPAKTRIILTHLVQPELSQRRSGSDHRLVFSPRLLHSRY